MIFDTSLSKIQLVEKYWWIFKNNVRKMHGIPMDRHRAICKAKYIQNHCKTRLPFD